MKVNYQKLLDRTIELFVEAGLCHKHAFTSAEAVCTASLRGTDSHGIRLIPHYIEAIKAGRIDAKAEFEFIMTSSSTGILNAKHGIAHAAVSDAMDHAIELAKKAGVGFVSVKKSNHCGAMAYYGLKAAKHDMIGLAFTNATAKLKTFGSTDSFFGINPMCITAPMEKEEPFCYDGAPSIMSNNKIKMYKQNNELLPDWIAANKLGEMTNDPSLSRMLFPIGGVLAGYKGFSLAMIADIFSSLLSGMPNGRDVSSMYEADGGDIKDKRFLGQFCGAIRVDVFEDVMNFKKRLQNTCDRVRNMPKESGFEEVMVAGDPEKKTTKERLINGIEISSELNDIFKF